MLSIVLLKINIQITFNLEIIFRMKVPLRNMKDNVGHFQFFELNTKAHIMICFYTKFSFWHFFFKLLFFKLKFALKSPSWHHNSLHEWATTLYKANKTPTVHQFQDSF